MDGVDSVKKPHRKRQSGVKAEKKKKKNKYLDQTPQQRNPKAFTVQSSRRAHKAVQRYFFLFFRILFLLCLLNFR